MPRSFLPVSRALAAFTLSLILAAPTRAQNATANNPLIYHPLVPFHFATGPETAPALVIAQVTGLAASGFDRHAAPLANSTTMQVWPPIQSYTFDYQALAAKGEFSSQPLRGLIYLVEDSGSTVAYTGVGPSYNPRTPGQWDVGDVAFSSGSWQAPELASSIYRAANFAETTKGSFEVRSLRNPPLYFLEAVWLKSLDGGSDFVYPYHLPTNSVFKPGTLYPLAEYLRLLRPLAQKRVQENAHALPGAVGG